MELIDLLFALIEKFVPITPASIVSMRNEAKQWRAEIALPENVDKPFNKFYLKINEPWFFRLLFAVAYLPIVKWLNQADRQENEQDEF